MKKNEGFTLIELSIGIVIIGIITGSIIASQSLIRASQLNALTTEIHAISTMINSFKLEHQHLPGDLPDAYDYWGSQYGCTDSTISGASDSDSCNGDGNGIIDSGAENFRAWQHLALAEVIPGAYTGVAGSGAQPNGNVFGSKIPNVCYSFHESKGIQVGHASGDECTGGFLTTAEAYHIDTKFDDRLPESGNYRGSPSYTSANDQCINNSNGFAVSNTNRYQCALEIRGIVNVF